MRSSPWLRRSRKRLAVIDVIEQPEAARARRISFESLERTQLSPAEQAMHAARGRHEVVLAVGRTTIAVRFARASAATLFAQRFADTLGDGAADVVVWAIDADACGYFWRSPDRVWRWTGELSDALLIFFADTVAITEYLTGSNDLGLHAAVVARGSHTIGLVGPSTAGKTTTALAAARNGFALYSDERCILQDGRVVPFLRAMTVRAGGRAALLADESLQSPQPRLRLGAMHGAEQTIGPRLLLGAGAGGPPRPLNALFIIVSRESEPSVEPCTLHAALPALLRSMVSRETGLGRAARALAEFRAVALYRLRLGTPRATADLIEGTIDEAFVRA
jgi:hypothetical protein